MRLAGKTILVTGAASGIGAACCRALAAEGMRVAVLDLGGRWLQVNEALCRIVGRAAPALLGRSYQELCVDPDPVGQQDAVGGRAAAHLVRDRAQ